MAHLQRPLLQRSVRNYLGVRCDDGELVKVLQIRNVVRGFQNGEMLGQNPFTLSPIVRVIIDYKLQLDKGGAENDALLDLKEKSESRL